ncbi:TetR/AcrR family transcriptional regulator C-terminal domain-containing protein [Actinocrispum wychmicini]|uniref:TetR family transcriptional regulator n=1 Tax=Actinocrispum wychmicini TaxID=1213861 RepID=A0A4R2JUM3_9PSEU|nr:TetR/AcrR family transcriptional regulator C-terminal domain-containing protein [Actinocrispum wychmicini]TCO60966.1 TetR family transcriptional regulator [Actinocrispum wychmicini]
MALDRRTVVRMGLQVLDDVGLDALTLRKIASELGVQPPALYWHFKSKQDLIDEMATSLLTEDAAPVPDGLGWREFATVYSHGLRRMLLRHRDGARMFAGTYLTDTSVYERQEAALRILTDAGFTVTDAAEALYTIYSYTIGFVIEEQAVYPRPGQRSDLYDIDRRTERMADQDVPMSVEAGRTMFADHDTRFARGIQAIITGVGAWVDQVNVGTNASANNP